MVTPSELNETADRDKRVLNDSLHALLIAAEAAKAWTGQGPTSRRELGDALALCFQGVERALKMIDKGGIRTAPEAAAGRCTTGFFPDHGTGTTERPNV